MTQNDISAHVSYRSMQTGPQEWSVFYLDDRIPDWWRVIARFPTELRAESYATVENDIIDDQIMPEEADETPPQSAGPISGIVSSRLTRRESITHTHVEREETVTLAEPQRQAIAALDVSSAPIDEVAIVPDVAAVEVVDEQQEVEPEESDVLPPAVDCATLDPLTPIQFKLLSVICNARGEYISGAEMDKQAEHSGILGHIYSLVKKGYIRARPLGGGRKAYDVLVFGAPRVERPTDTRGKTVREWTKEEIDGLSDLAPSLGDNYAKYAEKIDRTADAVMTKARSVGCFKGSLVPGYVAPKKAPVPTVAKPAIAEEGNRNMTSALMGDPISGRSAAERSDFDVKSYLVRKGHTAFRAGPTWVIDGRQRDTDEVLDIVNGHRAEADLPPLKADAIA